MDWNKLQHTLYNLDPTDPKEDLAKLQGQLQGSAVPVSESVDYVSESAKITEGSLSLDGDYSIADFAALAGIKITESKQKEGPAGQAKHRDPAPKKLPAGSTKNVSRDKLVGDSMNQDIEEAGAMDAFRKGIAHGGKGAEIGLGMVKDKALGTGSSPSKTQEKPKKKIDPRRVARVFNVNDPAFIAAVQKINSPGEQNISPREAQALAKAFSNMMQMSPRELQRNMALLKTQVTGTESVDYEQESIKERLYRELRNKGL